MSSDLALNAAPFNLDHCDDVTHASNKEGIKTAPFSQPWWEVGAPAARLMRERGEGVFPKPIHRPQAVNASFPSRDPGRSIPVRVMPTEGKSKGVMMHVHGGGWVLGSEYGQDVLLESLAESLGVTVVSIGYRLSPEHPYPAGPNDCFDAAQYLVDNVRRLYDGPLLYLGGESAGGHLSALTCFHLLTARREFNFKAVILSYGVFNLGTPLPSVKNFSIPLVLTPLGMQKFIDAFTPNMSIEQRTDPNVSPLYVNFETLLAQAKRKLPPAFFAVGTADCLVDDTTLMAAKWLSTGSPATVKLFNSAPHGFTLFRPEVYPANAQWREALRQWVDHL